MSNINSTQSTADTVAQITLPLLAQRIQNIDPVALQSLGHDDPSPKLRYVSVMLEQGRLGKGLPDIINRCVDSTNTGKASSEYIKVVYDHVFTHIQAGHIRELEGASHIRRIARQVRLNTLVKPDTWTNEEQIALEVVITEAHLKLSWEARRRWDGWWFRGDYYERRKESLITNRP